MKVVQAALLLACALSSAAAFEWQACSSGDLQTAKDVQLSPEPVPAGSSANFTIAGHSEVDVQRGEMQLHVYYLGFQVYHKTLPLPEPIAKGDFVSSFQEDFPAITPPGHYKVKIESKAADGTPLLCLLVQFKVTWGSAWRRAALW